MIHGLSTTISEDIGINPTPQLRQLVAQSNTSAFAENDLLSYINQTISEFRVLRGVARYKGDGFIPPRKEMLYGDRF